MWDICVGGVVASGETYEEAAGTRARRGARHRRRRSWSSIGAGRYEDDAVRLIGRCYRVVHDGPFRFVDGEVAEIRHVTASELDALARETDFVPDSWAMVLPLLAGFGS